MAPTIESHVAAIIANKKDPYNIGVSMAELHKLTSVVKNTYFYTRWCEILMREDARDVFCEIPNEDLKIGFLKQMAYKD